jgi:hypothetical protein
MVLSNDIQVGGTHYRTEYQHWDWAEDNGLGYLESAATKYLSRWNRKHSERELQLEDLRKAKHYTQKLLELYTDKGRSNRGFMDWQSMLRFINSNQLEASEAAVCMLLGYWDDSKDLHRALEIIDDLIITNFPELNQSKVSTDNPFGMAEAPKVGAVMDSNLEPLVTESDPELEKLF